MGLLLDIEPETLYELSFCFTKLLSIFTHTLLYNYYLDKTKKQPFKGIRLISERNINSVYQMVSRKAREKFYNDVTDIEMQMLSKFCTAIKFFELKEMFKKN